MNAVPWIFFRPSHRRVIKSSFLAWLGFGFGPLAASQERGGGDVAVFVPAGDETKGFFFYLPFFPRKKCNNDLYSKSLPIL